MPRGREGFAPPLHSGVSLFRKRAEGCSKHPTPSSQETAFFRATLFTCCPFLLTFKTDSVGLELNWKNILNSTNRWPFTDSWKRKILCFGLRQLQGNVQHSASCTRVVKQLQVITELENIQYLKWNLYTWQQLTRASRHKGDMVPMNLWNVTQQDKTLLLEGRVNLPASLNRVMRNP